MQVENPDGLAAVASIKLYAPAVNGAGGCTAAAGDDGAAGPLPPHPATASASVTPARGSSDHSREARKDRHL